MKDQSLEQERVTPNQLMAQMGTTPADNLEGYRTSVLKRSEVVAKLMRAIFQWKKTLEVVAAHPFTFGPFAFLALWQGSFLEELIIDRAKTFARVLASTGRGPDVFVGLNEWIESTYARLLYQRCGYFMQNGRFDREKAIRISSTAEGKEFLKNTVQEFTFLENQYQARGLTRLRALKELFKCLLMVITESPLTGEELPFMRRNKDGSPKLTFDEYVNEIRTRLENLHRAQAFDLTAFSEQMTGSKIGCSPYDIVEGSRLYSASLRYYPLPKGAEPNGKVLYLPTPLVNKPEIYDLAKGKSVIEGLSKQGYIVYMADNGDPGTEESQLGLDFYGKAVHDHNLMLITQRHPGHPIDVVAYCMAGTLILPYLARRAEERLNRGEDMDVHKVVLMASPSRIDDDSGYNQVLDIIRQGYDVHQMQALFGEVNIPVQVIESGMNQTQLGVQYYVASGFYDRALSFEAIEDAAPFFYWLSHGRMFPARAHREWIQKIFLENQIYKGKFCLPSSDPILAGKPVDMDMLRKAGLVLLDYWGTRDMVSPSGACVASEIWGQTDGENQTVEKNIGHIFVVSKKLLGEYLQTVGTFLNDT